MRPHLCATNTAMFVAKSAVVADDRNFTMIFLGLAAAAASRPRQVISLNERSLMPPVSVTKQALNFAVAAGRPRCGVPATAVPPPASTTTAARVATVLVVSRTDPPQPAG